MLKILCRLREFLIYVFKEIPIILLLEAWTIARVTSTLIIVLYIIINNFLKNDIDACMLSFFN